MRRRGRVERAWCPVCCAQLSPRKKQERGDFATPLHPAAPSWPLNPYRACLGQFEGVRTEQAVPLRLQLGHSIPIVFVLENPRAYVRGRRPFAPPAWPLRYVAGDRIVLERWSVREVLRIPWLLRFGDARCLGERKNGRRGRFEGSGEEGSGGVYMGGACER